MNRAGLSISNAINSGLNTYGQLQNIEARDQSMGLREADAKMRKEQHDAGMRSNAQQEQINNMRIRQLNEEDQQRALGLFVKRLYSLDSGGDLSTEELEQYAAITGGGRLTDPKYIGSKEVGDALAIYPRVLQGEIDRNSPEAIQAYNTLINVQRGAKDGRQVSINKIVPAKDAQGVYFGLNVVNADGTVNPNGVMTDNRSSDPNDPVSNISFDELNQAYGALSNLRTAVTNPNIRKALYKEFGLAGQPISAKDQSAIALNESRIRYNDARTANVNNANGKGGSGGNQPAKIQMIEFYRGMGYSDEDAISMANDSASSPEKFVTAYSKMLFETSKDINGKSTITPEDATSTAMKVYNENFRRKPAGKSGKQTVEQKEPDPIDTVMNMAGSDLPEVKPPLKAPVQAPPAALKFLKDNPNQANNFKAKYGYLPEGF